MKLIASIALVIGLLVTPLSFAQDELVQVHQDFSEDPGWDSYTDSA